MHYSLQSHEYNSEPTFPMWEGTLLATSSLGATLQSPFEMSFINNSNLVFGHRFYLLYSDSHRSIGMHENAFHYNPHM